MSRPGRLLGLVDLLSGRRALSAAEIAARLDVSIRTAYRDLAELEANRIALESGGGRYRLRETARPSALDLTARERLLLRVALANPALRGRSALARDLRELDRKLAAVEPGGNPDSEPLALANLDRTGPVPESVFAPLERAIAESRVCDARYESMSDRVARWRTIDPLRLFLRADVWYLAAWCHENREVRTFRLDRFDEVRPRQRRFEPPVEFDLETFLAKAWSVSRGREAHSVEVTFDATLRPLFARGRHHPGEEVTVLPDGRCRYRVEVSQLDEIARWLVGFGGLARVEAPEALRRRVAMLAEAAVAANRPRHRPRRKVRRTVRN